MLLPGFRPSCCSPSARRMTSRTQSLTVSRSAAAAIRISHSSNSSTFLMFRLAMTTNSIKLQESRLLHIVD